MVHANIWRSAYILLACKSHEQTRVAQVLTALTFDVDIKNDVSFGDRWTGESSMINLVLFMLVFCFSQASLAGSPYEMSINVNISDELLTSHSRDEVETAVRTRLADAETCINQAFASRQSRIRLTLALSSLRWLKKEEVALLAQSAFQPDRAADGSPIATTAGISTQNFTINYYDVSVNHVPFAFNEANFKITSQPDVASLIRSFELGQELKNSSAAAVRKLGNQQIGNLIRIAQTELFVKETGNWHVTPHELMHAIGGFKDNYTIRSHTTPNLMGSYGGGNVCVLNSQQIALFLKNRHLAAP